MKNRFTVTKIKLWRQTLWGNVALIIAIALIISAVLNLLWSPLHPSFPIPRVSPVVSAPVDGPFYLQNADKGYDWNSKDALSLWFHPLMSWLIVILPFVIPL